jgi:hypothetical protein
MKDAEVIYRDMILRAVFGDRAHEAKVADKARLDRICAHLVTCEEAQSILRHKGHGVAGMTFVEVARSVPDNVREKLKKMFGDTPVARYPDLGEVDDTWSAH